MNVNTDEEGSCGRIEAHVDTGHPVVFGALADFRIHAGVAGEGQQVLFRRVDGGPRAAPDACFRVGCGQAHPVDPHVVIRASERRGQDRIFMDGDKNDLAKLAELEDQTDKLVDELSEAHFQRIKKNECNNELSPYHSTLLSELERVADHLTNVGYSILNPTGDDTVHTLEK